jgi:hypothetical protein
MVLVIEVVLDDTFGKAGAQCDFANGGLFQALVGDDIGGDARNELATLIMVDDFRQDPTPRITSIIIGRPVQPTRRASTKLSPW